MIRALLAILAITFFLGCAASQPAQPKHITMIIDGNVKEIEVVGKHPCEGNWNFCDQVLAAEKWINSSDQEVQDELDTFVIPAF